MTRSVGRRHLAEADESHRVSGSGSGPSMMTTAAGSRAVPTASHYCGWSPDRLIPALTRLPVRPVLAACPSGCGTTGENWQDRSAVGLKGRGAASSIMQVPKCESSSVTNLEDKRVRSNRSTSANLGGHFLDLLQLLWTTWMPRHAEQKANRRPLHTAPTRPSTERKDLHANSIAPRHYLTTLQRGTFAPAFTPTPTKMAAVLAQKSFTGCGVARKTVRVQRRQAVVLASSAKTDLKKVGVNSVEDEVVKNNLLGV
jgi:hypothetical protein